MSTLVFIDPAQDSRWDEFVLSHPYGWICHLSGWKQVLENSFQHIKGHYLVLLDESGQKIRAGLPLFEVNSRLTGKRLVSIPYASLCDPLVSNLTDFDLLVEEVFQRFPEHTAAHFEVRSFAAGELIDKKKLQRTNQFCVHDVDLTRPQENLLKSFHRNSVRTRIKKAEERGISLRVGQSEKDLKVFYRLLLKTRKRIGRPVMPYRFFRNLWRQFFAQGYLSLLLAEKEGKPLSGLLIFKFKNRVSQEFSGSDPKYRDWYAEQFLTWQSIKLAQAESYEVLDFGRTGYSNQGLVEHKRRWGGRERVLVNHYFPRDIALDVDRQEDSWKFKAVHKLCNLGPECIQPLIGDFCYRHMG